MILPTDKTVFQNAWVVPDLDAAMKHWVDLCNVGPFFILDHSSDIEDVVYRGEPGKLRMMMAIAQAGPVQIELIQPLDDTDNCYRDHVAPGQSGFHHVCTWTHNFKADTEYYEGLGFPTANSGRVGDVGFAYYDTRPALNCMMEVMEFSPMVEGMFKFIADASVDWDGTNPVRNLG